MPALIQLSYFSSVSPQWSAADAGEIVRVSRKNNALRGVTGLLLFDKGHYLQVLEGDPQFVLPLFAEICTDPRHCGVTEIYRESVPRREFAQWSMSYHDLSTAGPEVAGYVEFLRTHFDLSAIDLRTTRALLKLFSDAAITQASV